MSNKGFTLVELAIVLVIIGVILGGVIKGQELVTNAKIQRVYREFQKVEFAAFSYYDRYNFLPGDIDGNKNGLIEASPSGGSLVNETQTFWTDVSDAGFFHESFDMGTTPVQLPQHALGGDISVTSQIYGFTKNAVCFSNITQKDAEILDSKFDDGVSDTGTIRAGDGTDVSAAYTALTNYTVCMQLD